LHFTYYGIITTVVFIYFTIFIHSEEAALKPNICILHFLFNYNILSLLLQ